MWMNFLRCPSERHLMQDIMISDRNLTMEQMYEDCLYHLYTADRRQNPYSIASINMYLFLKEEELRKLTTAMECIRYGLNPGETLGYVGGKI